MAALRFINNGRVGATTQKFLNGQLPVKMLVYMTAAWERVYFCTKTIAYFYIKTTISRMLISPGGIKFPQNHFPTAAAVMS